MFTLFMGDGSEVGPMSAEQLNKLLTDGIMGCGGAGRIESIIVNDVAVSYETFKAIYNAALTQGECECGQCDECGEQLWREWEEDHFGKYVDASAA